MVDLEANLFKINENVFNILQNQSPLHFEEAND